MLPWLLLRDGALGDALLTLPAARWLEEQAGPGLLLWPRVAARLDPGLPVRALDDLALLPLWAGRWPEGLPVPRRLFLLGGSPELARAAAAAGAPEVVRWPAEPSAGVHQAAWWLRGVGGPVVEPEAMTVPAWVVAAPEPGPDVVLLPGSGGARKLWPGFGELAHRLVEAGLRVVVPLGPVELERGCGPERFPVGTARPADLPQAASLCAGARLVVGNDSGPTHLAALVGAPVVALFMGPGAPSPERWRPVGPHVEVWQAASLSGRDAAARVLTILSAKPAQGPGAGLR